jgi:hypothetical protein
MHGCEWGTAYMWKGEHIATLEALFFNKGLYTFYIKSKLKCTNKENVTVSERWYLQH